MNNSIEQQDLLQPLIGDLICFVSVLKVGIKSKPFLKNRTEMPTIYLQTKKKPTTNNTPSIEKEKIAEECIQLKYTVNSLNKELAFYKSEVNKRDRELNNKNKVLQDIYYDTQNNMMKDSDNRALQKLRDNNLCINMKTQYKEIKQELVKKDSELETLKRTVKSTKINEIQNESLIYIEELKKLKAMYEIASQHSANYE
jgi:hypothetical protein